MPILIPCELVEQVADITEFLCNFWHISMKLQVTHSVDVFTHSFFLMKLASFDKADVKTQTENILCYVVPDYHFNFVK